MPCLPNPEDLERISATGSAGSGPGSEPALPLLNDGARTRHVIPSHGVIGSGRVHASVFESDSVPQSLSSNTPPMKPADLSFSTPSTVASASPNVTVEGLPGSTMTSASSSTISPNVTPNLGPQEPPVPKWLGGFKGGPLPDLQVPSDAPTPIRDLRDTHGWKPNLAATPFEPVAGEIEPRSDWYGKPPETQSHHQPGDYLIPGEADWNHMFEEYGNHWGQYDEYGYSHWDYDYEMRMNGMPRRNRKPRQHDPKVRSEQKVFIGGLSAHTTAKKLESYFSKFGTVLNASILTDAQSCRSRGFGFITFGEHVPDGVVGVDHFIDGRMCGARLYDPSGTAKMGMQQQQMGMSPPRMMY